MLVSPFLSQFKLTSLLEGDLSQTSREFVSPMDVFPNQAFGSQAKNVEARRLITYAVFLELYWPHFTQKLTKGLGKHALNWISPSSSLYFSCCADPALVFSELMGNFSAMVTYPICNFNLGVIQGSEQALSQDNQFLDKTTFQNLSHRIQHAFANRRDTIHSIFMLYISEAKNGCSMNMMLQTGIYHFQGSPRSPLTK